MEPYSIQTYTTPEGGETYAVSTHGRIDEAAVRRLARDLIKAVNKTPSAQVVADWMSRGKGMEYGALHLHRAIKAEVEARTGRRPTKRDVFEALQCCEGKRTATGKFYALALPKKYQDPQSV